MTLECRRSLQTDMEFVGHLQAVGKLGRATRRQSGYLYAARLLPTTRSGFRRGRSAETAIIRVLLYQIFWMCRDVRLNRLVPRLLQLSG